MTATWQRHVDLDNRARRRVWSVAMRWGSRSRGRVLRGILPVLALVWATLTWHDCYLGGMHGDGAANAAVEHCAHHQLLEIADEFALELPADDSAPSCDQVGKTAPELRPVSPDLFALRSTTFALVAGAEDDRRNGASPSRLATIPPDTPLHQRPARLLI
jgi:hypothetical protein